MRDLASGWPISRISSPYGDSGQARLGKKASGRPISRISSPYGDSGRARLGKKASGWPISRISSPYGDSDRARLGKKASGWPISRILSSGVDSGLRSSPKLGASSRRSAWMVISLDGASPRRSSGLPGTYHPRRGRTTRAASRPCLALLLAGVAWPPALLRTPVVSYTAFSLLPSLFPPLPRAGEGLGVRATCFCGPAPAGFPTRGFPRPGCYPAPCSLECGLSSIPRSRAKPRPSGQPEVIFIIPFLR